jgi:Protein of unknown function (DUF664)
MTEADVSAETALLLGYLNGQRKHVLGILDGLSEEDLRRPVLPSGWTSLGMVRHLALDVERFWFRAVVAGEQVDLPSGDEGWQVGPEEPAAAVLAQYREEAALADAIITGRSLDSRAAWWPSEIFPNMPEQRLRQTILHVIAETATHAGHLDAVRELIDGRTWLVLT